MIPFYQPLSPNPPLLYWNFNTFQTKDQKRRSDWCEIYTLMRRSDWCEIPTLHDLIGARYLSYTIWLVRATYNFLYANIDAIYFLIKKTLKNYLFCFFPLMTNSFLSIMYPLIPTISLIILLTICQTIILILVRRNWHWIK